jgi:hypothetical protein
MESVPQLGDICNGAIQYCAKMLVGYAHANNNFLVKLLEDAPMLTEK